MSRSTSEAHRRWRRERQRERAAEPDTSPTVAQAGQRGGTAPKPGEKNGSAKLTQVQVNEIRARLARLVKELAAEYGVSVNHVRAVCRGDYWRGCERHAGESS